MEDSCREKLGEAQGKTREAFLCKYYEPTPSVEALEKFEQMIENKGNKAGKATLHGFVMIEGGSLFHRGPCMSSY